MFVAFALTTPDPVWAKKKEADNTEQTQFGDAAVGRKYHKQIIAAYGFYDNDNGLATYVQRVGTELAVHAEGEDFAWLFTILDDESINAFATPGGYVYVTRALLAHLNTEAQLAAVLGHEIVHSANRHAARQHAAASVVSSVAASIDPTAGFNLGRLFGAGLVSGYGRDMELEADELGMKMISRAGYDPNAMLEVLALLKARDQYDSTGEKKDSGDRYHAMLASHPDSDRRLRELAETEKGAGAGTRDDGGDELLRRIDGTAWSGSRSQGVVRNNQFLHEKMDFAITFPEGWEINNLPDRIIGTPPDARALMQVTAVSRTTRKTKKVPVDRFLQKILSMTKWQNSRITEVNGLEAFIATAPKLNSAFGPRVGRIAAVFHGENAFIVYGVAKDPEDHRRYDRKFSRTIESVRALTDTDRVLAEPLVIRVVELPEDGSLADFAQIDDVNDPDALLRLLNGFYAGGEPKPGDRIKTIQ